MIRRMLLFCINGLRPLLGPAYCYYEVGCTEFARQQLKTESLFIAIWNIMKRTLSCNPLYFYFANKVRFKGFIITMCLLVNFQVNQLNATELQVESVSLSNCNAEKVRSETALERIITHICNKIGAEMDGKPTIQYTDEGYTLIQTTKKPRTLITLLADNKTNSISCTISTHANLAMSRETLKRYLNTVLQQYSY